jgi:hypothetical protein
MKKTRPKYHLFSELKVVDELAVNYYANPTKENFRHYQKIQNLFLKHCKYEVNRK